MIGMEIIRAIRRPIQPDIPRVSTAFFVAAAGTASMGTCAYPFASTALLTAVAAASVSASPSELKTLDGFPCGKQFAVMFGNKQRGVIISPLRTSIGRIVFEGSCSLWKKGIEE